MSKNFTRDTILQIRSALRNESAGNPRVCTMTEIDLAVAMLGELLSIKAAESSLQSLCRKYFAHPNAPSKTKKKEMRKKIRPLIEKLNRFPNEDA